MSTVKQRVMQLLKDKGVVVSKFFPDNGISYSVFRGQQLSQSLSSDVLAIILTNFPDANIDWILSGEGEMYKKTAPVLDKNFTLYLSIVRMSIKLFLSKILKSSVRTRTLSSRTLR